MLGFVFSEFTVVFEDEIFIKKLSFGLLLFTLQPFKRLKFFIIGIFLFE